jgi:hypothetical protein
MEISDVSRVVSLRKGLNRASLSMKVIGCFSALLVVFFAACASVDVWLALILGIIVLWLSFCLSKRIKSGHAFAARFITFWILLFLAWILLTAPGHIRNSYNQTGDHITAALAYGLVLLPVFFAIIGLRELRAYKTELASTPSKFDPLTLHPWENERKGAKRRPGFLNKWSPIVYFPLLLFVPVSLFFSLAQLTSPRRDSDPNDAGVTMWQIIFSSLLLGYLFARLYRRSRRHAMLSSSELLKKDNRDLVLYLRAFEDDGRIKVWARANDGRIFLERLVRISFEELITDHLWRFGPVVAIGEPTTNGKLEVLGAARGFEGDYSWQEKAIKLMHEASIIAAVVGCAQGLIWEINAIIKFGLKSKLVLVMPPVGAEDLRTRWGFLMYHLPAIDVPSGFDLAQARAVVFPGDEVVLIMADEQNDWTYETVLDSAAELILGDSFGKETRQKGQQSGELNSFYGTADSKTEASEIAQIVVDSTGVGSQSMKQYILDEINIFNIGRGKAKPRYRIHKSLRADLALPSEVANVSTK